MPRERRNEGSGKLGFYIDTNIALDYGTGRNAETVSVLNSLKEMGNILISSSFLVMEAADFRKDFVYIHRKAVEESWGARKILRQVYNKDLKYGDFWNVEDWTKKLTDKLGLQIYNFLMDGETWEMAQYISLYSNLSAPDAIHLSSAIVVAQSGLKVGNETIECKEFISNDNFLKQEAEKIKKQQDILYPVVLTIAQIKNRLKEKRNKT